MWIKWYVLVKKKINLLWNKIGLIKTKVIFAEKLANNLKIEKVLI